MQLGVFYLDIQIYVNIYVDVVHTNRQIFVWIAHRHVLQIDVDRYSKARRYACKHT